MSPLIADIDVGLLVGIIVPIGSVLAVALTAIVTHHSRRSARDDMEATLKMEMIQRGMSADEIERVLSARMGHPAQHYERMFEHQHQHQHQHQH